MLAMDRRPWFRRRVLRALAAEPLIFQRLLEIHVGAHPAAPVRSHRHRLFGLAVAYRLRNKNAE